MWNEKDTENNNTHTDHLIKKHLGQGHSRTLPTSELHLDEGKKEDRKQNTHIDHHIKTQLAERHSRTPTNIKVAS
jgi:hypothetical protein